MVADFVSTDYGWLCTPNGSQQVRVLFKVGKPQEGYFMNEDILRQGMNAMDILQRHYPSENHVFVFDNATTHLKRVDNALSARKMPKNPPSHGHNWGVAVTVLDGDGKPVFDPNGKARRQTVHMGDATFADGGLQCLYFREDHLVSPGIFKGMAIILEERGYSASNLQAECKGFKCPKNATSCCCRRMLYNEPDFSEVESLLETTCKARGFQVLFLPKFHCELNFIEQCWGYSKRIYRQYPISSKEVDLEHNVLKALDSAAGVYAPVCNLIMALHGQLLAGFEWETGRMGCKKIWGAQSPSRDYYGGD